MQHAFFFKKPNRSSISHLSSITPAIIVLLVGFFFFSASSETAFAQSDVPSPVFCGGSTNNVCPTPSGAQAGTTFPTNPATSPAPTGNNTPAPTLDPCQNVAVSVQSHKSKHKKKSNGAVRNTTNTILEFLIKLINLILQLLGGKPITLPTNPGTPQPTSGTQPTVQPEPTIDPNDPNPQPTVQPEPTTNPCEPTPQTPTDVPPTQEPTQSQPTSGTTQAPTQGNPPPTSTQTNACSSSPYDAAVLADNPIAYWKLNDTGATVADCSTNKSHTGKYVASPSTTTLPNGDSAKAFNGSSQYAEIPDANDLSVATTGFITIEAWMRPDVLQFSKQESSGYVHWMGKGVSGQHEYVARIYSKTNSESRPNRISGYHFNLSGGLGAGSYFQDTVTAGQWIHYALVVNAGGGYIKIFKNGVQRDQDALSGYSIVPRNGTAPFRIGTRDLNSFFQGAVGKVAVYNYELTPAKLTAHYNAM